MTPLVLLPGPAVGLWTLVPARHGDDDGGMTQVLSDLEGLYRARASTVDFIEVPKAWYLMVNGRGDPNGAEFQDAVHALYAVSFAAHFLVKRAQIDAPRVMPLEALWWFDDNRESELPVALARAVPQLGSAERQHWCWRAMILQLDPIDALTVARATEQAARKHLVALDRVRFEQWEEGRCAQTLHQGPFTDESTTILRLHERIQSAGFRPHGRHHEIYLNDPHRTAPEKLRTILRHPISPA